MPDIKTAIIRNPVGPEDSGESFMVGYGGVTRIEGAVKGGMYCDIPYVAVYKGDKLAAEFCQHHIVGVVFE